jgi:predicted dehydrogenase
MLDAERPDLVVVATPNHLHHPMAMAALNAGADVICEKPLGLDARQAEAMTAAAVESRRRTAMSFTWRYLPACVALRRIIDDGRLGEIYQVDLRYHTRGFGDVHGPMRWQFDRAAAGSGALANLGSHAVDLIHWWFGPISSVAAATRTVIPSRRTLRGDAVPVSVDDICAATLLLNDGTPVSLGVSWVAQIARVGLEVEVHGSKASARLRYATDERPTGTVAVFDEDADSAAQFELPGVAGINWVDLGQACVTRIVESFLAGDAASAPPTFDDGLRAQCALDAIIEAARSTAWVEVSYPSASAA